LDAEGFNMTTYATAPRDGAQIIRAALADR
jgi:hypothetical protein